MQREASASMTSPYVVSEISPDPRESAAVWRIEAERHVDALLDELSKACHLSDDRFIESRIHMRQARFGNRRIEQELREHDLKPAAQDLAALRQSERDRARQVLKQRFGEPDIVPLSIGERQRRVRFLASRGFSFEAIQGALQLPDE
jgi:regulatory protein